MTRKMGLLPGDFEFTRNWFLSRNLSTFREYVLPVWAGKPVTYLELGVFEGMSLIWMLQRVLTHPDCKAVGVDPWLITRKISAEEMYLVMERAYKNTYKWKAEGICTLIRGNSIEVLNRMVGKGGFVGIKKGSVDICMIDGNHTAPAVVQDAEKCLKLMKPGGWLLFDDVENRITKADHVKHGLEIFKEDHSNEVNLLWKDKYMECLKVK